MRTSSRSLFASTLIAPIALTSIVMFATAHQASATLLFDNLSNGENSANGGAVTSTSSTPNTFMGDGYTLLPGAKDITGFDVAPVNLSGTNYTGLQITIYVWGTVNTGTVSAATPAFSNLLATYSLKSAGTFTSGFYYTFQSGTPGSAPGISLATPLAISSNDIGLTFAYAGTTDGVTYAAANSLTSLISYGSAPTVGSNDFNGYYRNANSEVNGNFTSTNRSLGLTNQSVAVRVFGDSSAPEPSAVVLALSGGLLAVGGVVRRRRSAK